MRKTASIVIGLGYGDEGKGLTTDFLCHRAKKPVVVRFNGGHQAGHTVVMKNGTSHVFSSFGAGTLRGVPTYWSKYCTFSPAYLLYELDFLPTLPELYVDRLCPVTTHYDVLYNRKLEARRGINKLGSCGVGFGATIDRHNNDAVKLYTNDLSTPRIFKERLGQIRNYYKQKFEQEIGISFSEFDHDLEDAKFYKYVEELQSLKAKGIISLTSEKELFSNDEWGEYIFEGAQGMLLDQNFGMKPYITKSNTSTKNALEIIKRNIHITPDDISIYYVSRGYLTRHGNGPFREFPRNYKLKTQENETNVFNEHQGSFRCGFLDLDLMTYSLNSDDQFSSGINKNLVVTCLDRLPGDTIVYLKHGVQRQIPIMQLPTLLNKKFKSVLHSFNPCSDYIIGSYSSF